MLLVFFLSVKFTFFLKLNEQLELKPELTLEALSISFGNLKHS